MARFRATHALRAVDPAFVDLFDRLRRICPDLAGWREARDVRASGTGLKVSHHASPGPLRLEYATVQADDDPNSKLAVYTPA